MAEAMLEMEKRDLLEKRECADILPQPACDNTKNNGICEDGAMGNFGSTMRNKCKKTCGIC